MLHPEIDASDVCPMEHKIKFTPDGTVEYLYSCKRRSQKRIDDFKDIDDIMATVLLMKAASKGDLEYIYDFIESARDNAIATVARILSTTFSRVRENFDEGADLFKDQLATGHCRRVIPLFAWLCRCIKSVILNKSHHKHISLERAGIQ